MIHPDKKLARRFDLPGRSRTYTELVYSGDSGTREEIREKLMADQKVRMPGAPEYNVYFGDIHGHSNLSDGRPGVDEYFIGLRDRASDSLTTGAALLKASASQNPSKTAANGFLWSFGPGLY